MSRLELGTRNSVKSFRPGEAIEGAAGWQLDDTPRSVEVRLFWYTRGKGTEDAEIVEVARFDHPQKEEARPFRFVAPEQPYSFSGQLISLIWALELVVEPGKISTRLDLTLAPGGQEILLHP